MGDENPVQTVTICKACLSSAERFVTRMSELVEQVILIEDGKGKKCYVEGPKGHLYNTRFPKLN